MPEPKTLGQSQRPRVPTPWGLFLNLRDPKAWDSLGHWDCPKDPEAQHHGGYFSISEIQKPGTVWDIGTVPKTQSPNTMGVISQSQRPKSLGQSGTVPKTQSPKSPGQSQDIGTVPEVLDSPGKLRPNTMGVISQSQRPKILGQFQAFGICPRSPGQSQVVGTVPQTQSPNTIEFISKFQRPKTLGQFQAFGTVPEARDSSRTLGLSQRPRVPTSWSLFLNRPKSFW